MITNTSNVRVEITLFASAVNFTALSCYAVLRNRNVNSDLYLLNASMDDKIFARKMSNELGVQLNMDRSYWISITPDDDGQDVKRAPDIGFYDSTLLDSALLHFTFGYVNYSQKSISDI